MADESALISKLNARLFEEIEPAQKKGETLFLEGIQSAISAISVHPSQSILAIAGCEGFLVLWDYSKRGNGF